MKDTRRICLRSGATPGLFRLSIFLCALCASVVNTFASDFAAEVVSYTPAPGQFVNNPTFNDPARALGAPIGGGLSAQDNAKVVSLGGFGGSVTLRFDHTVLDDPLNPWGIDAIVYSNAFYAAGNTNRRFAEAATIEISRDANANGLADDAWFIIRGSHLPAVPANAAQSQMWDNNSGTPAPPTNLAWYPSAMFYPGWPGSYTTTACRLPALFEAQVVQNPNGLSAVLEGYYGYADLSPTLILGDTNADDIVDMQGADASAFYTSPDNPFAVGMTPGSGGGDGFDIAWAVDRATGAAAELAGFDFIRITTAVNRVDIVLGEMSSEVGGVADVRPKASFFDVNLDGRTDVEDLYAFERTPVDLTGESSVSTADRMMLGRAVRANEFADVTTP